MEAHYWRNIKMNDRYFICTDKSGDFYGENLTAQDESARISLLVYVEKQKTDTGV